MKKPAQGGLFHLYGAPGRIRTSDPLVRSPELESRVVELFTNLAVAPVAIRTTLPGSSQLSPAKSRQSFRPALASMQRALGKSLYPPRRLG